MKRNIRLLAAGCALALCCASGACSASAAPVKTGGAAAEQVDDILGEWALHTGSRGTDETPRFTMEPGDGTRLRWYCRVDADSEPVHVYLYDIGKGEIVSAMSPRMDPGESRTLTYHVGSDSTLCQFRIMIESVTGGTAMATVRANQIF